ncbi:endonuclease III [Candidatus Woesearchaeota archaeon]|nr:endonuclease III [Candidatus Woesearchaeota archaeon]
MSARSRDETTEAICERLFKKYPNAAALASAPPAAVERIIKKIGFYHNKAKHIIAASRIVVNKHHGKVPDTFDSLLQLPGVGRKVAGCVMVYAFHQDAIPVDTHVHRISNRLGWVATRTPEQTERELIRLVPRQYWQAVNDSMVSHGKRVCKPITPLCSACCVETYCKKVGVKKSGR